MIKEQVKGYRKKAWREKREEILQRDNYMCQCCGRHASESVVLHVHHLTYIRGCQPWDYPAYALQTLCAGCHSGEHGHTMPKDGWIYDEEYDTEDYGAEQCQLCNTDLRYVHVLHHPNWGMIMVGCECAQSLLSCAIAEENRKERTSRLRKYKTFMESPKWKCRKNGVFYEKEGVIFAIWDNHSYFSLCTKTRYWDSQLGYRFRENRIPNKFKTLNEAKSFAFNILHPLPRKQTTSEPTDSTVMRLSENRVDRISLLSNLCFEVIRDSGALYIPSYKTIGEQHRQIFSIQQRKPDELGLHDVVVVIRKMQEHNAECFFSFYIKFLFGEFLQDCQIAQIRQSDCQFITIDCRELMKYDSISAVEVHDFFQNHELCKWVNSPIYDHFLVHQLTT